MIYWKIKMIRWILFAGVLAIFLQVKPSVPEDSEPLAPLKKEIRSHCPEYQMNGTRLTDFSYAGLRNPSNFKPGIKVNGFSGSLFHIPFVNAWTQTGAQITRGRMIAMVLMTDMIHPFHSFW